MFDFSWSEILLIGVVALVVIGPKDLPRVLRTVGQWASRARAVAREFQFQLDEMIRTSELDEVRKTMNAAASGDIDKTIRDFVDPTGEIHKSVAPSEMMGDTAPPPPVAPNVPETPPPEDAAQLTLPTIDAPIPLTPREPVEAALPEPKSGTHG